MAVVSVKDTIVVIARKTCSMITSFSWQQYVALVSLLLALYYLYVGARYYRPEITQFLQRLFNKQTASPGKTRLSGLIPPQEYHSQRPPTRGEEPGDALFGMAKELTGIVQQILEQAGARKLVREELVLALQLLLSKKQYAHLSGTPYEVAITNFITTACVQYCSIHLEAAEIRVLWKREG